MFLSLLIFGFPANSSAEEYRNGKRILVNPDGQLVQVDPALADAKIASGLYADANKTQIENAEYAAQAQAEQHRRSDLQDRSTTNAVFLAFSILIILLVALFAGIRIRQSKHNPSHQVQLRGRTVKSVAIVGAIILGFFVWWPLGIGCLLLSVWMYGRRKQRLEEARAKKLPESLDNTVKRTVTNILHLGTLADKLSTSLCASILDPHVDETGDNKFDDADLKAMGSDIKWATRTEHAAANLMTGRPLQIEAAAALVDQAGLQIIALTPIAERQEPTQRSAILNQFRLVYGCILTIEKMNNFENNLEELHSALEQSGDLRET